MLGNAHFYNRTIRKVVVAFGSMFNDILLTRYSKDGLTAHEITKVPLSYGAKEKYLVRLQSDPNLTKSIATTVPRMSFDLVGMTYDTSRKQQTTMQNFGFSSGSFKTQYAPIPYNLAKFLVACDIAACITANLLTAGLSYIFQLPETVFIFCFQKKLQLNFIITKASCTIAPFLLSHCSYLCSITSLSQSKLNKKFLESIYQKEMLNFICFTIEAILFKINFQIVTKLLYRFRK